MKRDLKENKWWMERGWSDRREIGKREVKERNFEESVVAIFKPTPLLNGMYHAILPCFCNTEKKEETVEQKN